MVFDEEEWSPTHAGHGGEDEPAPFDGEHEPEVNRRDGKVRHDLAKEHVPRPQRHHRELLQRA